MDTRNTTAATRARERSIPATEQDQEANGAQGIESSVEDTTTTPNQSTDLAAQLIIAQQRTQDLEMQRLKLENDNLRLQLELANARNEQSQRLDSDHNNTTTFTPIRVDIPKPKQFDGTAVKLAYFLTSIKIYFDGVDPRKMLSDVVRIQILSSLLTGTAEAWYASKAQSDERFRSDFSYVLEQLERNFTDHQAEDKNYKKFSAIKQQAKQSVESYYIFFMSILALNPQLQPDSQVVKTKFLDGLADQRQHGLRYELDLLPSQLKTTLQQLYYEATRIQQVINSNNARQNNKQTPQPTSDSGLHNNDKRQPLRNPHNISSDKSNEKFISKTDMKKNGLCFICKQQGHRFFECPQFKGSKSTPLGGDNKQRPFRRNGDDKSDKASTPRSGQEN
jgi:hypothetical protein